MWRKLSDFLKLPIFKDAVKSFVFKALGIAGGFKAWILSLILGALEKRLEKEVDSQARLEDQTKIDNANLDQYQKDKAAGAPSETLTQDELNLLNGADPHPKFK